MQCYARALQLASGWLFKIAGWRLVGLTDVNALTVTTFSFLRQLKRLGQFQCDNKPVTFSVFNFNIINNNKCREF